MPPSRFYTKKHLMCAVASVTIGASLVAADAASIPVPNYSFELPSLADGGFDLVVEGWLRSDGDAAGLLNPQDAQFPGSSGLGDLAAPAHGLQSAFLGDGSGGVKTTSLTTTAPLTVILANVTYTLRVAFGSRLDFAADPSGAATFGLLANGLSILESSTTFTTNTTSLPLGTFVDYTTSFTTTTGSPLIGQNLTARISYTGDNQVMFDNVRVNVDVVPEPTSAILLASTVPLFWLRRRR